MAKLVLFLPTFSRLCFALDLCAGCICVWGVVVFFILILYLVIGDWSEVFVVFGTIDIQYIDNKFAGKVGC